MSSKVWQIPGRIHFPTGTPTWLELWIGNRSYYGSTSVVRSNAVVVQQQLLGDEYSVARVFYIVVGLSYCLSIDAFRFRSDQVDVVAASRLFIDGERKRNCNSRPIDLLRHFLSIARRYYSRQSLFLTLLLILKRQRGREWGVGGGII